MTVLATCFGGLRVTGAGGRPIALSGRRADALLARLVWEAGRPVPREALVSLLWPEREGTGGAALRQAVHVLRGALGHAAVETAQGHVALAEGAVDADLSRLRRPACAPAVARDLREAAAPGSLFAGLRGASAAHDAWLDMVRARADALAAEALIALAQDEMQAGQTVQALRSARVALEFAPASTRALDLVVEARLGLGERHAALRDAQAFARRAGAMPEDVRARLAPAKRSAAPVAGEGGLSQTVIALGCVLTDGAGDAADALSAAGARDVLQRQGTVTALIGDRGLRQSTVTAAIETARRLSRASSAPAVGLCLARCLSDETGSPHLGEVDRARVVSLAHGAGPGRVGVDPDIELLSGAETLGSGPGRGPGAAFPPFVGRHAERLQIDAIWRAIGANGAARLLVIGGGPGIGKSRLMSEQSRAMPTDAVLRVAPRGGATGGADVVTRLAAALGRGPGMAGRAQSPDHQCVDRIGSLSAPRMILVEDAETLDSDEAEALLGVIRALGDRPVLWVLLVRSEAPGALPLVDRVAGSLPITEVFLNDLSRDEAATLAGAFAAIGPEDRRTCLARAGGNPLFLSQVLQHTAEGSGTDCPASVEEAIAARLDALDAQALSCLRLVALLGDGVPDGAVRDLALAGEEVIERLARRRLIRRTGSGLAVEHDLIRAALVSLTPPRARREIHLRAAHWFRDRDADRHAWHLWEAGERGAAEAMLAAARGARGACRWNAAADLAAAGAKTAGHKVLSARLLLELGHARTGQGSLQSAAHAFDAAMHATLDREVRAEALVGLANLDRLRDDPASGFAHLDRAEPLVACDDLRARLLITRGRLLYVSGRWRESIGPYRAARALSATAGDRALEAEARGGLADAAYAAGHMQAAERHVRAAEALASEAGRLDLAGAQSALLSHVLVYGARLSEGDPLAARAAREAREAGDWRAEINARLGIASAAFCRDDLDRCAAAAARAAELAGRVTSQRFSLVAGLYRARIAIARGAWPAARDILDELGRSSEAADGPIHAPQFTLLRALAATDPARCAEGLEATEAALARGTAAHNALRVLPVAVLGWRHLNEPARARVALDALRDPALSGRSAWRDLMIDSLDALVACGDVRAAAAHAGRLGFHRLAGAVGRDAPPREALLVC